MELVKVELNKEIERYRVIPQKITRNIYSIVTQKGSR